MMALECLLGGFVLETFRKDIGVPKKLATDTALPKRQSVQISLQNQLTRQTQSIQVILHTFM